MTSSDRTHLTAAAGFYFCIFGALGALFPFLPILLRDRGFSGTALGALMATLPISNLVVPPLWGLIADLYRARSQLLFVAAAGAGLTLLLLIPEGTLLATMGVLVLINLFRAPLTPLADASTRSLLGAESVRYGQIRVWGSIGFALAVWATGALDAAGRPALMLGGTGLLYLAAAGVSLGLPRGHTHRRQHFGAPAWALLRRPRFLLFLAGTAAYYAGHATYDAFISLHLEDLGASHATIGESWAIGVSGEILIMFAAPHILRVVRGSHLLVLCSCVAALRWYLLATVTTPALVLLSQPLHGLTFGLWFVAFVDQAQEQAPDGLRSTVQTLASASMGVGMVLGYLGGGRLMDLSGTASVFQAAVGAAAVSFLLYAARLRTR